MTAKRSCASLTTLTLLVLAVLGRPLGSRADEPPEPPSRRRISSGSCSCWAYTDPQEKVTIGYRAKEGSKPSGSPNSARPAAELWRVPGWFAVAAVNSDCQYLVTGYSGANLLPLDYDPDVIMLSFYSRGQLLRQLRLKELVLDLRSLRRTESHWEWGSYIGVEQDRFYRVQTNDRGPLLFDMATGQLVSERR